MSLHIADDGVGFDVTAWNADTTRKHWGLVGMRERARKISAQFEIASAPGQGTTIRLNVRGAIAFDRATSIGRRGLWLLLGRG
jgi:signal transduction histidine kinase